MSRPIARSQASVCQLCDFIVARRPTPRYLLPRESLRSLTSTARLRKEQISKVQKPSVLYRPKRTNPVPEQVATAQTVNRSEEPRVQRRTEQEIQVDIVEARRKRDSILHSEGIPREEDVIQALAYCQVVADQLVEPLPQKIGNESTATSALLSIDEISSKTLDRSQKLHSNVQAAVNELSSIIESIIRHPTVFISPEVLRIYVEAQARLGKSRSFPEIFLLYASKPVPQEGTNPIAYSNPNPNKVANAVPSETAALALQTAIEAKELLTAMNIVESAYNTPAFQRAKFLRKGLVPATGLAVAPAAAYVIASQFALLQTTMDSAMATNIAFAGITAYIGFTATIGFVAISTANDQMDRVTWAPGTPLRERWIREDERAAVDKIAGAWGFKEVWRRGEEDGQDWDMLREWVGRKGMMLDRVELMEGME
jgi:hypothetical protein